MATLKQLRGRIKAAKNIRQITRAMKLVAAARLKRATERALAARPYAEKLREVVGALSQGGGSLPSHPLLEKPEGVDTYALVLITGERGLCGSYNTNLIRTAGQFIAQTEGQHQIVAVGKKGNVFFSKRGYNVVHSHTVPSAGAGLADAKAIGELVRGMFERKEVGRVYVCYSKFYSPIRQVPQVIQLLPIEPPAAEEAEAAAGHATEFLFEPEPKALLEELLPRYFLTVLYQCMLEATASEFGARMTAMTNATDSAGKMIQNLTLKANRERQAQITKEILEVVGGAEALNG